MAPPEETPLKLFSVTFTREETFIVLARDAKEAEKACQECPDNDDFVDSEWQIMVSSLEDDLLLRTPELVVHMAVNRSNFELVNIVDFDGPVDWRSSIIERARRVEQAKFVQVLPGCG